MGEILGLGFSHYPGPAVPAEYWPRHLRTQVERGRIPVEVYENRALWPEPMVAEWGDDEGQASAARHQAQLVEGFRRLRRELDAFNPDLVVMWGDDQYENFKKDCVPPFCIFLQEEMECMPLSGLERGAFRTPVNVWGLPSETKIRVRGHKQAATGLTRYLLGNGFDVAYALQMRFEKGLSHSFANGVIYLDFDQAGFNYPLVPFHVNCYGNQLMTTSAAIVGESTGELSPPAPSPRRCFEIGQATARFFKESPWRVALVASSSWSHGSLTEKHQRLYPDVESDRRHYAELTSGRLADWGNISIGELEESGQHEMLNWICLAGAMVEAGQQPSYTDFAESYIFNSTKCFAAFQPNPAAVPVGGAS
jgi:hypothetical protein